MSFILDALKKSENDRQDSTPAEFTTVASSAEPAAAPRWLWILGGLLLLNTIVLGFVLLKPNTPAPVAAAAAPQPTTPAVVAAQPPRAEPQPQATDGSFSARVAEARRDRPPARTAAPPVTQSAAEEAARPEPAPAVPQTTVPATRPAATSSAEQAFLLPTATQLRVNGTLNMPDLHLDIHVHSETPDDRFVFINMSKYRENDRTSEGPVINEITTEGVILDYQGHRFLLPRE